MDGYLLPQSEQGVDSLYRLMKAVMSAVVASPNFGGLPRVPIDNLSTIVRSAEPEIVTGLLQFCQNLLQKPRSTLQNLDIAGKTVYHGC